jgi:threonine dehydratase
LIAATSLNNVPHAQVHLKLESEMPTGSFKVRGALYALHAEVTKRRVAEVVASSTGNHGAAVAHAATLLNIPAKIFLPINANPTKQARIRAFGAEIVEHGKDISEAFEGAWEYAKRSGSFLLNDATNRDVLAGTATIAVEIIEQLPDVKENLGTRGRHCLDPRNCICRQTTSARSPACRHSGGARACLLFVVEAGLRSAHRYL